MSVADLQAELAEHGCVLWVEGEMLRFRAPDGVLTPPLMARLKRHKKELIRRLRDDAAENGRSIHSQQPTFGQQAMWLLHETVPESAAYNVGSAVKIHSQVDFEALKRVWRTLVARHDSLRTTFETCAGRLVAKVHQEPPIDVENVPACGESDVQLADRVEQAYRKPFDLAKGPLARLRLFTAAPDRHVLLMSMHHIVLDAWSLWVLHEEIGSLYAQECRGEVGMLPATAARFEDFVRWQQEMPNTEAGRQQWAYWKNQLAGDPDPARLPWDHPRPARMEQRGESVHFRLPADLAGRLRELGRSHGATPFVTLLSVFQALLHRHSGQTDFLVGTTTSGRSVKQFSRLVGYLVNTLPLRTTLNEGDRFCDLLEQSREATLGAMAAQDFPFPLIVERLNPPREGSAPPLCRVMFGLQKPHDFSEAMLALDDANQTIDWGGLVASAFPFDQQEGQFDLTLEMYETTSSFLGVLKYDPCLLDRQFAEAIVDRYEYVARQIVERPDLSVSDIDLATPSDQEKLQVFTSPTNVSQQSHEVGYESARLDELFIRQATTSPSSLAIVEGDFQLTYREVDQRTNQMAAWLRQRGVGPGAVVGCCLTRGATAWLAHLACLKAGAVYVPIEETGPAVRVCSLLRDCQATLLLSDSKVASRLEMPLAELPSALELLDEAADEIDRMPTDDLAVAGDANDDAYVIYTSGSTGAPKGVAVSHAAFLAHLRRVQACYEITPADRVLQFSSLTFDPSLEQAWSAWSSGATLVVRGPQLWSAAEFWRNVRQNRVTVANLPPAYFRECSNSIDPAATEHLRLVIVGGDTYPQNALSAWQGKATRLLNAYGPTEAVVTATVAEVTPDKDGSGRIPIGIPLPDTQAYVVDTNDHSQAIGVPGELLLAGPALASRYLNDAELTSRKFAPIPSLTGDERPVYRTGDLVRWNFHGQLEFIERIDRQVKIDGYRIELGEVERSIEQVVGVRQAIALVQSSPDGSQQLVAYYSTDTASTLSPERVKSAVRARLPQYMTPVAFCYLDEFPLNASGKIAVKQLPPIDATPAASSREYVEPTNDLQKVLCQVWSDVLGVEQVGIHDDFFELGGASLKSLQIVAAAEERGLKIEDETLSPALLFEYPTIAQLAEFLSESVSQSPAVVGATN